MKKRKIRGWIGDIVAVLIFLFLFPYFALSFKEQKQEYDKNHEQEKEIEAATDNEELLGMYKRISDAEHNKKYYVIWREGDISLRLPLENFIIGALAGSISADYEKEVLCAQAILLRSTLAGAYEKEENGDGEKELSLSKETGVFWTDAKMHSMWGKDYDINLQHCVDAVQTTQGIYVSYKNKPISGCYHRMSAGQTRDGKELSKEGEYDYLKKVMCHDNLEESTYSSQKRIPQREVGVLEDAVRNDEGYVISIKRDNNKISGEELREQLGLASANMSWEEDEDDYVFSCKGYGHGFGLDQHYGNILAKEGKDYQEIIEYFFENISLEKME